MPSKRKSWLPFSNGNGNGKSKSTDPDTSKAEQTAVNGAEELSKELQPTGEERLRPIQFAPNRLATLYVTPSERNLYLAAMSQLDQNPPHLALWSDPAPSLPPLIQGTQPSLAPPDWPRAPQATTTSTAAAATNNAKLISSPEAQTNGGLMIRDEFRRLPPAKLVRHASITLTAGGGLRFVQFPANVLIDLEQYFPANKVLSEPVASLRQRSTGIVSVFNVQMFGSMWKRAGSEELDPIRMLVSILGCVGTHGWSVINSINAGTAKGDVKSLLLTYDEQTAASPPAYFALSFPLPDRVSLIFPPPKATPALISAIRNAITTTSSIANHSRSGTANTIDTQTSGTSNGNDPKITWKERKAKIKLEGWVHDGVYRFWIDGMRRKLVGGVKKDVVASLQPHIVLNVISALSSMHYTLSTSIPLQPATAGRDILLFASQPDTGVAATDAFRPKTPTPQSPRSKRSESPVLVQRTASLPPAPAPADENHDPRNVDPEKRVLPWTSTIMTDRPAAAQHSRSASPDKASLQPRAQSEMRNRDPSIDSARPLLQSSSVQSSPRPRNVLLKKNSVRNRTSSSESRQQSIQAHSRQASDAGLVAAPPSQVPGQAVSQDRDAWNLVDPPYNIGHLGVTMYSNVDAEQQALAVSNHQTIPAPQVTPVTRRQASDQQSVSGESVYETPAADVLLNPPPPRPLEEFNSSSLPLGKPMSSDGVSVVSSIPTNLPLRAQRSPNRVNNAESVDIGVPSVYGSVGYLPSMISQNPSMMLPDPMPAGHSRSASEALDVLMGQGAQSVAQDGTMAQNDGIEDRKGKGKEGSKRVWDEDKGAWADLPATQGSTNGHGNGDGPGSARTRISVG